MCVRGDSSCRVHNIPVNDEKHRLASTVQKEDANTEHEHKCTRQQHQPERLVAIEGAACVVGVATFLSLLWVSSPEKLLQI